VPAAFVHGVPDTATLWDPIVARLARDDVVALRLPGFGVPLPPGFACTKEEYAAWIVEQLHAIAADHGGPVDLVGHDWGGVLVQYVGSGNPDVVRSWAVADGPVDDEYVWHDAAQLFQTPEIGEQVVAAMGGDGFAETIGAIGHPDPTGCHAGIDDTMRDAILRLYRSAVRVGAEWQPTVERNERPALVLWGTDDAFAPADPIGHRLAARVDAELVLIPGGHWAPFEHPDQTVGALESFWSTLA
jgi:pimeloyl-ACP methyl ester carboxylesterase